MSREPQVVPGNEENSGSNSPPRHQLHGYARELYMDLEILGNHFTQLFSLSDYFASTGEIKSNLQEISALIVAIKNPEHSLAQEEKLERLKEQSIEQIQEKLRTIKAQVNESYDTELQSLGKSAIMVINSHLDYLSAEVHRALNKAKEQINTPSRRPTP